MNVDDLVLVTPDHVRREDLHEPRQHHKIDLQPLEQLLVHFDLLALNVQPHLARERASQRAQGHGESLEQRPQRCHAQLARGAVQFRHHPRQTVALLAQARLDPGQAVHHQPPRARPETVRGRRERVACVGRGLANMVQVTHQLATAHMRQQHV